MGIKNFALSYYTRLFQGLQKDILIFPYWCFTFTVFRWLFIAAFYTQVSEDLFSNLLLTTYLGLRLSLKTCGIITILSFLVATLPYVLVKKYNHNKARLYLHSAIAVFYSITTLARIPYYRIFNQAYNMMLINGMHDDKLAILDTAIKEYGLLYRLPLALLLAAIMIILLKKYYQNIPSIDFADVTYKKTVMLCTLPFLVIFWVFCRYGGAFRYQDSINWESAGRTKYNLLNEAVLDDGQAFYRTWAMKKMLDTVNDVNITTDELRKRIAKAGGNSQASSLEQAFLRRVEQPRMAHQPKNIVLIAGESFGLWPLLPQFSAMDLVPETKSILESSRAASIDTMLAHGSGTVIAFNGLVTGLADAGLYENYQVESFKSKYTSGIGHIMKQLGYKTVFWYGGFATWEGSKKFALAQNFDEYHCADEIKYEGGSSWGCPDVDLFAAVEKYLEQQDEKTFCLVLTATNHPPYIIDLAKENFPADKVRSNMPASIANNAEMLNELGHIWYADKAMGQFVKRMEQKEPDSLFIITGDHSERFTFTKQQDTRTLSAIPCIFYGKDIKPNLFATNSLGCHMQIAGTLAEMYGTKGFTYTAYMPNMFAAKEVWNHRLYSVDGSMLQLKDNKAMQDKANNLRSLSAWRVLKGNGLQ